MRLEVLKLAIVVIVAAFLWHQVSLLRKARSAEAEESAAETYWIIQMLVTENESPIGVYEFVYPDYAACQEGARSAREAPDLTIVPACLLRWSLADSGTPAE